MKKLNQANRREDEMKYFYSFCIICAFLSTFYKAMMAADAPNNPHEHREQYQAYPNSYNEPDETRSPSPKQSPRSQIKELKATVNHLKQHLPKKPTDN